MDSGRKPPNLKTEKQTRLLSQLWQNHYLVCTGWLSAGTCYIVDDHVITYSKVGGDQMGVKWSS